YIEKNLLPDLGRQLSIPLTGQVYSLGLGAADLGDIILGDALNPAVSIGSIHVDYSLAALLAKKPDRVKVNGLTLHLEIADGRIVIPGLDPGKSGARERGQASLQEPPGIDLPLTPANFEISNGLVELRYEGEPFYIPFDLKVQRQEKQEKSEKPLYSFTLQLLPQGEDISVAGSLDFAGNKSILSLAVPSLDLNRFTVFTGAASRTVSWGDVSIMGNAVIKLKPFELLAAKLAVDPELLHIGKTPVRFAQIPPDAGPAIILELESKKDHLLIKAQSFVSVPLAASLALTGSVIRNSDSVQGTGNIVIRIAETMEAEKSPPAVTTLESAPELHGDFILALDKTGTWKAELKSPGQRQQGGGQTRLLNLRYGQVALQTETPSLAVLGQGTADTREVRVKLAIPKVQASYDGAQLSVPEASLRASYRQENETGRGRTHASDLAIALGSAKFDMNGLGGKADISLNGEMAPQLIGANMPLQAEGRIRVANAEITERGSRSRASDIKGDIPLFWPQSGREMAGEIEAARIRWQDVDLGSFRGDIKLKDMMYSLDGNYSSSLLKGFVTKVSGRAGFAASAYLAELGLKSEVTPFAAVNLGIFDPALKKSYFSGELGLDTFLKIEPGGMTGTMQLKLQNGKYEFPEKKYEIKGIGLSMLIPSLPDLRTAPAQTLDFAEAAIGNLAFSKGKFVWQLESKESFFLEEGVVQWAGGRIFTNAVRISPAMKETVVPIFCDRLKLTEILRQLGVTNAEGEGTVNGRLPLRVGKETIRFEDGFLYSSPGQGGSVKVAAFDLLSAGIPKNTPQFAQVDFAAEALKNFQYNWVKLLLNTEDEDLVMQMQMDGRPVQSLPFKYDTQTGFLQRMENSGPGINQPIRLDVNFRLPLNRFLGYSGKIQDIMKKMK
ncbi:MAG: hypothetical protein AMJ60_11990, partial [Desulfobacterales bacterium SG8_35]